MIALNILTLKPECGPAYEILVLTPYVQMLPLNIHADISSSSRGLIAGLALYLHPYFEYASSDGYGQHMTKRHLSHCRAAKAQASLRKLNICAG